MTCEFVRQCMLADEIVRVLKKIFPQACDTIFLVQMKHVKCPQNLFCSIHLVLWKGLVFRTTTEHAGESGV